MVDVRWITAFLDLAPDTHQTTTTFWLAVTGASLSPTRGEHGEFATLVPRDGDDHLRVQRLGAGLSRVHLDLHDGQQFTTHTSPGGLVWCSVDHPGSMPPQPIRWPDGQRSQVDQVCVDIPSELYDDECDYWSGLTGWAWTPNPVYPELRRLQVPDGLLMRVLLQRLDEPTGAVRAHLDLATDDRSAETARHVALGAEVLDTRTDWTVLRDPSGSPYCITDRVPWDR
jgi:Glyoxalase-like domain